MDFIGTLWTAHKRRKRQTKLPLNAAVQNFLKMRALKVIQLSFKEDVIKGSASNHAHIVLPEI